MFFLLALIDAIEPESQPEFIGRDMFKLPLVSAWAVVAVIVFTGQALYQYFQQGQQIIIWEFVALVAVGAIFSIGAIIYQAIQIRRLYDQLLGGVETPGNTKTLQGVKARTQVYDLLVDRFSVSDLEDLVFELGASLEWNAGTQESKMARDIVNYYSDRGEMHLLGWWIGNKRKDIDLTEI